VATAWVSESVILYLRKEKIIPRLLDHSALLTGLLIAISLPPFSPWWLVVIGTSFSIIIAKHLYGGLGHNIFNPAMVGYVVLLVSFPVQMTTWYTPETLGIDKPDFMTSSKIFFKCSGHVDNIMHQLDIDTNAITQATPLNKLKIKNLLQGTKYKDLSHDISWEIMNIGYLAGGLFLILRKVIRWHIPISMLSSILLCSMIYSIFSPDRTNMVATHFLSGSTMLGAFFIATDPVSSSTTNIGRIIYGAFAGFLIWLMRHFSNYPDGMAFALIIANMCVPLIDQYTQPRIYGN
jgi:electron transport complex protein RnfD